MIEEEETKKGIRYEAFSASLGFVLKELLPEILRCRTLDSREYRKLVYLSSLIWPIIMSDCSCHAFGDVAEQAEVSLETPCLSHLRSHHEHEHAGRLQAALRPYRTSPSHWRSRCRLQERELWGEA
jgi:hypothetical protein